MSLLQYLTYLTCFCSVVVITFASHAKGPWFETGQKHFTIFKQYQRYQAPLKLGWIASKFLFRWNMFSTLVVNTIYSMWTKCMKVYNHTPRPASQCLLSSIHMLSWFLLYIMDITSWHVLYIFWESGGLSTQITLPFCSSCSTNILFKKNYNGLVTSL